MTDLKIDKSEERLTDRERVLILSLLLQSIQMTAKPSADVLGAIRKVSGVDTVLIARRAQ